MLKNLNSKVFFSSLFLFVLLLTPFGIEIQTEGDEVVGIPEKDRLRFAAWNIERLGEKERGEEEFKAIAHILNKYDFIAITELMKGDVIKPEDVKEDGEIELVADADLKKILDKLSKDHRRKFKYLISPRVGWKGSTYQEHYAFLYDEALVCVVPEGEEGNKKGYPFREAQTRPKAGEKGEGKLIRPPFWATFRAGNFDFSVAVVHTQPKRAREENEQMGEVYQHVQEKNGDDEDDVLLVGDFNLHPGATAFNDLLKNNKHKVTPRFRGSQTTNIWNTKLNDNIFFEDKHLKEYLYSAIDRFDETEFGDDDDKARHVSDHRPVWAVFSIDLVDDDPNDAAGDEDDPSGDVGTIDNNTDSDAGAANTDSESTDSDVQPESEQSVYRTTTGKKYHRDGCRYLKSSKIPISLTEAKQKYSPCSVCNPPQ